MQAMEGVRLKMYWEQGYNWQDEYVERKCKSLIWLSIDFLKDISRNRPKQANPHVIVSSSLL